MLINAAIKYWPAAVVVAALAASHYGAYNAGRNAGGHAAAIEASARAEGARVALENALAFEHKEKVLAQKRLAEEKGRKARSSKIETKVIEVVRENSIYTDCRIDDVGLCYARAAADGSDPAACGSTGKL